MPHTQPIMTPFWALVGFFSVGVSFIIIGAIMLQTSSQIVEVIQRYDQQATCTIGSFCTVTVDITQDMPQPVYMYYRLTNFHQNHRLYVKSRSDPQLDGSDMTPTDACSPRDKFNGSVNIYPCGFIAGSVFSDRYTACVATDPINNPNSCSALPLDKKGIAWKSDVENKFKKPTSTLAPVYSKDIFGKNDMFLASEGIKDEDLVVWMRTSALPDFKKLHRVIRQDLKKGSQLRFNVSNQFDVSSFYGSKAIVLSTMSWLGGKHTFLGAAFLVVGIISLLEGLVFLGLHLGKPSRQLGDLSLASWNAGSN